MGVAQGWGIILTSFQHYQKQQEWSQRMPMWAKGSSKTHPSERGWQSTHFGIYMENKKRIHKNPIRNNIKKQLRNKNCFWCKRGAKIESNSMPKFLKHRWQNLHRKDDGKHEHMFFWHGNSFEQQLFLKALLVECANGAGIKKNSKMIPELILKSMRKMQNRCSNKWCRKQRKSSKPAPKGEPNTIKNKNKKTDLTNHR